MARFELSFTPTFYYESLDLPRHVSKTITRKLETIADDPYSARGDAKKLKGYDNVYRVRVGDYRICYCIGKGWVKLLSVRKRDERTYEDDLPDIAPPALPPDPVTLTPRAHGAVEEQFVLSKPPMDAALLSSALPPSRPLPFPITEDMLERWRIPAQYRTITLTARTEDDLLNLPIPERHLTLLLDNLFPRSLDAIAAQPEFVLSTPVDIERFAEEDLTGFLLRLTPDQERLVNQDRRGPILVRGGPGTGKSTLALYRVQRLLEQGVTSVLFTTYTNALVAYSEQLLTRLLGASPDTRGVKVTTVDSLAFHYFARGWGSPRLATEGQATALLMDALANADIPAADAHERRAALERLGAEYLLQEFLHVIEARNINSLEEYLAVERHGRRMPLKPALREALWAIYVSWRDLMRVKGLVLNEQVRRGAMEFAATLSPKPYQALVIDEAQDLSPAALRFLLNLVETPEHVYLTADASQSIYQCGFSWKQVHRTLAMAGRTILLKQNFRNTAQILAACAGILAGSSAGEEESVRQIPSAHHGDPPLLRLVNNDSDESEAIRDFFLEAARRYRLPTHSGAVLCTSRRAGEDIALRLTRLGMPAAFQSSKDVDITTPKVKVLTLHSAKGLEFPFVAVVGLDEGRFPRISADLPVEEAQMQEDEQRRLFFVGCSRAMRALLVCGSQATPSPFLTPLQPPVWRREV
ncbi:3'-5' exonuclease [Roseiflexus castenholzii]|uniref:DNA 3'-5' helicase n=1 Tax=Roseiflexus castenholzii (strain DSM 13941 / HLO8) TaxID=383372 RepID=A7NR99_ROSCS|nr:3'-5' exonuclease [Roseiflexus castenholzii]ABU60095.1 UvrD/REP helicase [Roseiflexus castenholzii DSM 13941]